MNRSPFDALSVWGFLVAALAVGASLEGCTGNTCEDTATCPGDGSSAAVDGPWLDGANADAPLEVAVDAVADVAIDATADATVDATVDVTVESSADSASEAGEDADGDSTLATDDGANPDGDADATLDSASGDADARSEAESDVVTDAKDASTADACSQIPEDCTNGVDDNCNGKIDCADPECMSAGFVCAATYAGWFGPVILYDQDGGASAPTPPQCPDAGTDYATQVFDGHRSTHAPPAVCPCACGAPADAGCPGPTIEPFSDPDCGTSLGSASTIVGCYQPNYSGANSVWISAPTGQTASCTPSWTKNIQPSNWTDSQRACQPARTLHEGASGGCSTGQVCVDPLPATLFTAGLCVYQQGDQSCSGMPMYPKRHPTYDGGADTRDCDGSACGCTPAPVSCALSSITTDVSANSCTYVVPVGVTSPAGQCLPDVPRYMTATATPTIPSSCVVQDAGVATGGVTPTGELTFCCMH
jgi:hypothetical protein